MCLRGYIMDYTPRKSPITAQLRVGTRFPPSIRPPLWRHCRNASWSKTTGVEWRTMLLLVDRQHCPRKFPARGLGQGCRRHRQLTYDAESILLGGLLFLTRQLSVRLFPLLPTCFDQAVFDLCQRETEAPGTRPQPITAR